MVLCSPRAHADVQYVYDANGRLVQAVAPDGSSAVYNYDPAGNILSIQRLTAGQLFLASFSPLSGVPGTQVTLNGSGFSTTAASNAVTFNGTAASVVSSTANQVVVTVPAAAATGPIAVTVGANTVTSSQNFVVQLPPSLSGFTPAVVNAGATVTVNGANLDPLSGATQVAVGTAAAQRLSLSATQLTLRAPLASGRIIVTTPYGSATSVTPLIIAPSTISAANIVASGVLAAGSSAQALNINQQSKYGVFAFDGTQDQLLSVQVSSVVTTPANASLSYQVFSPARTVIASGSVTASSQSIHLPKLPSTGTYLVIFGTGSATAQFNTALEINAAFSSSGVSQSGIATTSGGQTKRMWISATAGQHVGVGLTGLTMSGVGSITVALYRPDNTYIWGRSCNVSDPVSSCGLQYMDLPVTGNYILMATPNGTATMSFNLTVSPPIQGNFVAGQPVPLSFSTPGQFALYTFTVTQEHAVAVNLGSVSTTPGGQNMWLSISGPTGNSLMAQGTTGGTYNFVNLAPGTYRVFLVPYFAVTGSAQLIFSPSTGGGSITMNDPPATFSTTLPAQPYELTFNATAGIPTALAVTNLVTSPSSVTGMSFQIYNPSNGLVTTLNASTSAVPGQSAVFTPPVTGTYRIYGQATGAASASFKVALSSAFTSPLVKGAGPLAVNLALPGQFAQIPFTVSAGESLTMYFTSVATVPANTQLWIDIVNPGGSIIATAHGTAASRTVTLNNLAAGTYKINVWPTNAVTTSMQIQMPANLSASLAVDAAPASFNTTVPGQPYEFAFTATAGVPLALAATNLVMSPSSVTGMSFQVFSPSNSVVATLAASSTTLPGVSAVFTPPTTGTYRIYGQPSGMATASFKLALSRGFTTPLVIGGGPLAVNLALPGQFAQIPFTVTAGQSFTIYFDSVTTVPANTHLWIDIVNPGGSIIASAPGTAATRSVTLNNLAAGTYKIYVWPTNAVTTSMQIEIPAVATAALSVNGATTGFSTAVSGQPYEFTFTGTSGVSMALGVTNLVTSPTSISGMSFTVYGPSNNSLGTLSTSTSAVPGQSLVFTPTATGTHRIYAQPSGRATVGFNAALSTPFETPVVKGGGPLAVSMPLPGQFARIPFNVTAGQSLTINFTSVTTVPANTHLWIDIVNPGGTIIATAHGTSATRSVTLNNLSAGTYQIKVWPTNAVTTSMQVEIP
jgi:YD repeat-containing protein